MNLGIFIGSESNNKTFCYLNFCIFSEFQLSEHNSKAMFIYRIKLFFEYYISQKISFSKIILVRRYLHFAESLKCTMESLPFTETSKI